MVSLCTVIAVSLFSKKRQFAITRSSIAEEERWYDVGGVVTLKRERRTVAQVALVRTDDSGRAAVGARTTRRKGGKGGDYRNLIYRILALCRACSSRCASASRSDATRGEPFASRSSRKMSLQREGSGTGARVPQLPQDGDSLPVQAALRVPAQGRGCELHQEKLLENWGIPDVPEEQVQLHRHEVWRATRALSTEATESRVSFSSCFYFRKRNE